VRPERQRGLVRNDLLHCGSFPSPQPVGSGIKPGKSDGPGTGKVLARHSYFSRVDEPDSAKEVIGNGEGALGPGSSPPLRRPYVCEKLALFLSLTNLRGVPYSLNGAAPGSIEETTIFYGDRIRFQTVCGDDRSSQCQSVHALDLTKARAAGGWDVLQTAAMATGAFPAFLAPRILQRRLGDYIPPLWESVVSAVAATPPPIAPNIPGDAACPFATLNVDGGVTNNDPFNYANDYLIALDSPSIDSQNPQDPVSVDRAVISIAPFPTTDRFDPDFNPTKNSAIFSALPRLFAALIFWSSISSIVMPARRFTA